MQLQAIAGSNTILGLLTLTLLELVLGIDNLVFMTLLASKLRTDLARKANFIGLSCALIMRICLLLVINWASSLTKTLFVFFDVEFTARSLILLVGGLFLLAKGTIELHEKIEGSPKETNVQLGRAVLWQVVAQIIVLDAIFSLDSIITAVGLVHDVKIMILAIVIAVIAMGFASNSLMGFVKRHPTVIILCLGFLMMIGFSLVVEALGFDISKGYLYAAIGFSIAIELINQFAHRNRKKHLINNDLRSRTASAVLRLLGGRSESDIDSFAGAMDVIADQALDNDVFKPTEKEMIKGVLDLADRPVRSIMSPRNEVEWLDLTHSDAEIMQDILKFKHSKIILARKVIDEFAGVVLVKDLIATMLHSKKFIWKKFILQPLVVHENTDVLTLMEKMRKIPVKMAIIVDEHGSFEGVVTPADIFKAIAVDFLQEDDENQLVEYIDPDKLVVDASIDIRYLSNILQQDLVDESDRYSTLSGYLLWQFGYIPVCGEILEEDNLRFEILAMERHNISKVSIVKLSA